MKILFVTNGYPTSKHPEYCVFTKEQIESVQLYGNFESELFFINAREKGSLEYLRVIKCLRNKINNYDILHVFHGLSLLLVFFLSPHKKILVSFLNNIDNEFGEKKFISKFLSHITKRIIKRDNIKIIFKDKIPAEHATYSYYLPNGVDTTKFYSIPKIEAKNELNLCLDKRYILFVSSKNKNRKQKRYDRFKKVLEILKEEFPDVEELLLVNEPRSRILYYFNAAEIHLLTSDFEGSPNSVKEAIACNTPVVATNTGNIEKMIKDIESCFISYNFDEHELAKYCSNILKNPKQNIKINQNISLLGLDMKTKTYELIDIYNSFIDK